MVNEPCIENGDFLCTWPRLPNKLFIAMEAPVNKYLANWLLTVNDTRKHCLSHWIWVNMVVLSTWKNDVCDGSIPVDPAGTITVLGATAPTLAGAPTLYFEISSFTSLSSPFVNKIPTFPWRESSIAPQSSFPDCSQYSRIDLFIMVFFPIRIVLSGRRPLPVTDKWVEK